MVIFRENTEDIYAGIEWAAGTPEAKKVIGLAPERDGGQEDPLPGDERHRHQADLARGHRAARRAPRSSYALAAEAQERDARAQGQHHEVHRGRVPRLGLRASPRASSATETVTERESWILGNKEARRRPLASRRTRRQIDPGYDMMTPEQQAEVAREVEAALALWPTHGDGKWKKKLLIARLDRRHHAPAGAHAAEGLRRHRDAEPERRLPLRRAGGAGRRHRHRARRQHQLRDRPRHLRGDARHGAEVRQPRQGEPGLGDPVGRDDARATWAGTRRRTCIITGMDGASARRP